MDNNEASNEDPQKIKFNRPLPELIAQVSSLVEETNTTIGQINGLIQDLMGKGLEVSLSYNGQEIPVKLKFKIPD